MGDTIYYLVTLTIDGKTMAHYVYLGRWTSLGAKELKDSASRSDAFIKEVASLGGKVVSFLHTMGQYDAIVVAELPSDEAANIAALRVAMKGYVSTVTLKGWTNAEYAELVKKA